MVISAAVFAACGFASAQVANGFVVRKNLSYAFKQIRIDMLQSFIHILVHGALAQPESAGSRPNSRILLCNMLCNAQCSFY